MDDRGERLEEIQKKIADLAIECSADVYDILMRAKDILDDAYWYFEEDC